MDNEFQQRSRLLAFAQRLKPVVRIGSKGLTSDVLREAEAQIEHHELIKVRIDENDREKRKILGDALAHQLQAKVVQRIGKVVVLFRAKKP